MKTFSATPADIDKKWIIIDAEGVVLGRPRVPLSPCVCVASTKATFTPSMDMGDNVIVINADKVQLNRQKNAPTSVSTGTPATRGGIKSRSMGELLEGKYPERVVTKAVQRMLPGGKNCPVSKMTNLRVYAGAEHPHEAQNPEVLDVKSMNKKNTRSA